MSLISNNYSILKTYFRLVDPAAKSQFLIVAISIIITAISESAVVYFIYYIMENIEDFGNREKVDCCRFIFEIYVKLDQFLIPTIIVFLGLTTCLRLITNHIMFRNLQKNRVFLTDVFLRWVFSDSDSKLQADEQSNLKSILSEIDYSIGNYFVPIFTISSSLSVVFFMSMTATIIISSLTLYIMLGMIAIYVLCIVLLRSFFSVSGDVRRVANTKRFNILNAIIYNKPTFITLNVLPLLRNKMLENTNNLSRSVADLQMFSSSPRYLLEFFLYSFLLYNISADISGKGNLSETNEIIILGAVALKILPALQVIYAGSSSLAHSSSSFSRLLQQIDNVNVRKSFEQHTITTRPYNLILHCKGSRSFKIHNKRSNVAVLNSETGPYCLVGKSGVGKTTLLKAVADIENDLTEFVVDLVLDPVTSFDSRHARSGIVYCDQDTKFFDETLCFNLTFRYLPELSRSEIKWLNLLIKAVGLMEVVERLPHNLNTIVSPDNIQFSGGEIQRFGLVRSMFSRPSILLLDEPTSSLDKETAELVWNLVSAFSRRSMILSSSHDINFVNKHTTLLELKANA